ncbi:MAG: hypothetical protein M1830_001311 [Pleopsidium flavum]|nr:MAG: hypothetical protein M1830_001311 [Pleopsidium flavum]
MADDKHNPSIDETPISPVQRRDSLEKHLQQRPDPKDLKDRHILLDTNAAPALQSAAQELERQRATDSLKKSLEKRPEREELIERMWHSTRKWLTEDLLNGMSVLGNILPDSTAAPALQGQQRELQKHMRADSLEQKIQHRPKPEDLIKEGILEPDEDPRSE